MAKAKNKVTQVPNAGDSKASPLWERIRDLEARRDGLRRQLDGVDAELLALASELASTVRAPGPATKPSNGGAPNSAAPTVQGKKTFTGRVLELLKERGKLTANETAARTDSTPAQAKRTLQKLFESGRAARPKPGVYVPK